MEIGVYKALEQTLALYSNVAIAWVGALVADLVVNKPLGLRPQGIEFKRAHLYDINPVGVGAMLIATIVSISAFYGLFGPTAKALSRLRGAGGGVRHRAADRVGHRRQILHRAQAETQLAEPRSRSSAASASIRSSRRTWRPAPPMPARSARCAARSMRAATISASRMRGSTRRCRRRWASAAGADLCPYQLAVRALSRGVRGVRRVGRADARADLSADLGDGRGRQCCRCPTCCGRCSSRSPSSSAWWRGCSYWRSKAAARPKRDAAADHAAHAGNRRAQAYRRRTAARQGSGGIRQSCQEPLCRRTQPRTALAAKRDQRLRATA